MIVLDVNVLVGAWNLDDPNHQLIRPWLEARFADREPVGIPWMVRHAFVRIVTNSRLFSNPLGLEESFDIIEQWSRSSAVFPAEPGPNHAALLRQLALESQSSGSKLTDAVLAAIALEHGATLASTDRDFRRFPQIKWIDPTAAP